MSFCCLGCLGCSVFWGLDCLVFFFLCVCVFSVFRV